MCPTCGSVVVGGAEMAELRRARIISKALLSATFEYIEISMAFQFQERIKIAVEHINKISNTSITEVGALGSIADARHAPLTVGAKIGQRGNL